MRYLWEFLFGFINEYFGKYRVLFFPTRWSSRVEKDYDRRVTLDAEYSIFSVVVERTRETIGHKMLTRTYPCRKGRTKKATVIQGV